MTNTAVLNSMVLGYPWRTATASRPTRIVERDEQDLDPVSLQLEASTADFPRRDFEMDVDLATNQASLLSLRQRLRVLTRQHQEIDHPTPAVLSDAALNVLGENGRRRFQEFRQYQEGWHVGQGKALSARSVSITNSFLTHLPELVAYHPSLFLTPAGNLELAWEDTNGRDIEVEFGRDGIEYFIEALDEEDTVRLDVFPQFVEKVRSLIR